MRYRHTISSLVEWARKIASLAIALIFAASFTIAVLGNLLVNALHDETVRDRLIAQSRISERGRGWMAMVMVSYLATAEGNREFHLPNYSYTVWDSVGELILPSEWLEDHLRLNTKEFVTWLGDPQTSLPAFHLEFSPIKRFLAGPRGGLAILPLLQQVPTCPVGITRVSIMQDSLVTCLPIGQDITVIAQSIAEWIGASIPQEMSMDSLQESGLLPVEEMASLQKLRETSQALEAALILAFRLALLALGLFALLQSASIQRLVKSLPFPLFLAGGFSLACLALAHIFVTFSGNFFISFLFPYLQPELQSSLVDVVNAFYASIQWTWLTRSLYPMAAASLIILLRLAAYRWMLPRLQAKPQPLVRRQRIKRQFR
jgi:hypothetical protein